MLDESIKRALEETLQTRLDSYALAMFEDLKKLTGKDSLICPLISTYSTLSYEHYFKVFCIALKNKYGCSDGLKSDLDIMIQLMDSKIIESLQSIKAQIKRFE
jgi:hypothetical protein